ncbi:hypothetical protein I3760_08G113300 [Carya illinoinensis]|nr:hypothetical protein I3760_08G113300 [Carya illinoinensis]
MELALQIFTYPSALNPEGWTETWKKLHASALSLKAHSSQRAWPFLIQSSAQASVPPLAGPFLSQPLMESQMDQHHQVLKEHAVNSENKKEVISFSQVNPFSFPNLFEWPIINAQHEKPPDKHLEKPSPSSLKRNKFSASEEEQFIQSKVPKITQDHKKEQTEGTDISMEDNELAQMLLSMQEKIVGKIKKKKDCIKNKPYTRASSKLAMVAKKLSAQFWNSLNTIHNSHSGAWLCIGDFNDLVNQSEKFGGRPVNSSSMGRLKNMMNKHGLVDMGFSSSNFTWTNNRQGKALIRERLDRGIANTKWRLLFPDATIQHLVSGASDHHPLLLNTFKEFWTKEPIIGTIIQEAWGKQVRGNPSFILYNKIKTTKEALKLWNKVHFGRIQENIKQLESEITHLQSSQPNSRSLQKENQLNIQLQDQLRHKETLWHQKSRINWLTTSDLNTKFYHLSTTIRRRSNGIDSIKIGPGNWTMNQDEIELIFVEHFRSIYTSTKPEIPNELEDLFQRQISEQENGYLTKVPEEAEIYEALKQIPNCKAPGPDGMTTLFYKHYWNIKWKALETNIAFIPKVRNLSSPKNFRPISLTNKMLPSIISPFQTAFVPGRNIKENSIIAHELFHHLKKLKGKKGQMAIKLDMEKAFDFIEWDFLFAVIKALGYSNKWINLVRECFFKAERGVRQGDPISPFLFILCTEVLSRLIARSEAMGTMKGLKLNKNCPSISHLLFADDLIIFGIAEETVARNISRNLDKYHEWSDQRINKEKSSIYITGNTNQAVRRAIIEQLEYRETNPKMKYLEGWRSKLLSQAGRMMLIRTVASTIPTYQMSTHLLPKSVCKSMNTSFKNFWWGTKKDQKHKLYLKSWKSICQPKKEGGLGLRLMENMNMALLTKTGWEISQANTNIWHSLLTTKYLKTNTFWQVTHPLKTSDRIC